MALIKRIFLFLAINFLVILTLSSILHLFHLQSFFYSYGINLRSLFLFCFFWGMGGSFISLCLSRFLTKWMMKVKIIKQNTLDEEKKNLLLITDILAKRAGLSTSPEVGIYSSKEVNAFATGPTKKKALIAVSTGLLEKLEENEIEAIIGHEISHIANGDMVTMTLLQGVINAFVMFLARVLAFFLSNLSRGRNNQSSYYSTRFFTFFFEIIFMVFGMMVIASFSRWREFRADKGGALLAGKEKMIEALKTLRIMHDIHDPLKEPARLQAFKISSRSKKGWNKLFSTHPSLEDRIERLKNLSEIC